MIKKVLVLLIMSALNLTIFVLAVSDEQNLALFFLMHATSSMLFYLINYYYLHINASEYPIYVILCFPGIGFTLFSLIYFMSVLVPTRVREIDHITIVEKEDDYVTFSFLEEGKVLTHLDSMNYLSQQEKLSFIFDVLDSDNIDKASVLKESLMGENYDLRYYSSIYLSSMSNRLEGQVFKLIREYEMTKEYEVLKALLEILKMYIETDLLENQMLDFYNDLYIKHLKTMITYDVKKSYYTEELIKAFIRGKKYNLAQQAISEVEDKHYSVLMLQFELYYLTNDYDSAKTLANRIVDAYKNIPSKDLSILNYWR